MNTFAGARSCRSDAERPEAESLAQTAWNTGCEYQQMAALEVLHSLGSPLFEGYRRIAEKDERQYLSEFAKQRPE